MRRSIPSTKRRGRTKSTQNYETAFSQFSGTCAGNSQRIPRFARKRSKTGTLAFIPTAGDPEEKKTYIERERQRIRELGFSMIEVDLKEENEASLRSKLNGVDMVYVNGGNSFYLLDWARKSGFAIVAKEIVNNGTLYFGTSAGSYIACPTIAMALWKHQDRNIVGLTDLNGLDLVPFMLSVHYTEAKRPDIDKGVARCAFPCIVLTDQQAVVVEGEGWKLAGSGKVLVLNKGKAKGNAKKYTEL